MEYPMSKKQEKETRFAHISASRRRQRVE